MEDLSNHVTDFAVIAVLMISGIWAFMRGLVHEVLTIGAWIGAIFAALYGYPVFKPYVEQWIHPLWLAHIATGAGLFLVTLVTLWLVTKGISNQIRRSALNALDRSLGFLYGLVRGTVMICLTYIVLNWFVPEDEQPGWLVNARSLILVKKGAALIVDLVPDELTIGGAKGATGGGAAGLSNERVFRLLNRPEPKEPGTTRRDGYQVRERREIERLLRTNQ